MTVAALVRRVVALSSLSIAIAAQTPITGEETGANDWFGFSVDLQGSTLVVGAPQHDHGGFVNSGGVYVFTLSGSTWSEIAELAASGMSDLDRIGSDVAIDGDTIAVGAEGDVGCGAVYVFARNAGSWSEQARIIAADCDQDDYFGRSLALSGDTLVVGAPGDDENGNLSGAIYVSERAGTSWSVPAKILADGFTGQAAFGTDVAIDGDTMLASLMQDNSPYAYPGAVLVYLRSGSTWALQATLRANSPSNYLRFGYSLALEGDRAVMGSTGLPGYAYVLERSGTTWTEIQRLEALNPQGVAFFGSHVALHGARLAVGAIGTSGPAANCGSAYVFDRLGNSWVQSHFFQSPTPGADDAFATVAIHSATVVVGETRDNAAGTNSGSAHVFDINEPVNYCTAGTTSSGCLASMSLLGVASASNAAPAFITATGVEGQRFGLLFAGFGRAAIPWYPSSSSYLCVAQPVSRLMAPASSGGNAQQCDGAFTLDFNASVAANGGMLLGQAVVAGSILDTQAWFRDPPAVKTTNLSNGLEFAVFP